MRFVCMFLCLWAGIALAARAADDQPHPIDAETEKCVKADSSTAGMIQCAARAETAWDKELNAAYRELQAHLKSKGFDDQIEALRLSQRTWLTHRDREFGLFESLREELEGTMWGPVMADQRMSHVRDRAMKLRVYLDMMKNGKAQ